MREDELILSDEDVEEEKGRIPWRKVEKFVFGNRWAVVAGLGGLLLLGAGLFLLRVGVFEGTKIEVIEDPSTSSEQAGQDIVVEIAGEVISPGVYKLGAGSRVEDLLVAAGGLSVNADREWVEKNLNRAAKLADGAKIYVPAPGESPAVVSTKGTGTTGIVGGASVGVININTATAAELDTLWGIGPARAQAIIEGRPYSSVEELLARKIIPSNVYERIKDEITAP